MMGAAYLGRPVGSNTPTQFTSDREQKRDIQAASTKGALRLRMVGRFTWGQWRKIFSGMPEMLLRQKAKKLTSSAQTGS